MMGLTHKIQNQIKVKKSFYQQERGLFSRVIFFSLNDEETAQVLW